jgi:cytoskeletal protein CcmA (bactofilin family)
MDGEIKVSEILTLKSTAVVTGDMKIATLVVEPNAKFDGTCSMIVDKA